MWNDLKFRLRSIVRRRSSEAELRDEFAFHLERQIEKHLKAGETREEAERLARIDFGAFEQTKEACRDARGISLIETSLQDLRYGLRMLWRRLRSNPILTVTTIICLALGIGGVTAVFSVVSAVLLRALPYPDSERLVLLRTVNQQAIGEDQGRVSPAELRDWQILAKSFEAISGFRWLTVDLLDPDHSDRLQGLWVTPEFFNVFGIHASAGYLFDSKEAASQHDAGGNVGAQASSGAIVLGRTLWERRFGMDASVVGRSIPLGICCPQQPQTVDVRVIGAVANETAFPPTLPSLRDQGHGLNDAIDYWAPLDVQHAARPSTPEAVANSRTLEAAAKLKSGVTVAQAQSEMNLIAQNLERTYPDTNRGSAIQVVPIQDELFASLRPILFLFVAASTFVLLIACTNVAVLFTFNAVGHLHEVAVRAALGAGRRRMVRQFVSESVLLTFCGGTASLLVAVAAKRFLISLAPPNLPRLSQASLDFRTLALFVAATLVCGVGVGLIPAVRILKFNLEAILRSENSHNATSQARARTYEPLLVLQVALTVVLVIGSGLMVKSLNRLLAVTPGFRASNILTSTLSLPSAKHAWNYNAKFGEQVLERIKALPGVQNAAYIRGVPMDGMAPQFWGPYWPSEKPVVDPSKQLHVRLRVVSRGYFQTMGIPLDGRDFMPSDEAGEKIGEGHRVIINEALARLFWPGQRAVGKSVNRQSDVIGVAGDVRYAGLDNDPIPEVYLPAGLYPQDVFSIVVRTASYPTSVTSSVRAAIHEVEKDVFISDFQTMNEVIDNSTSRRRFVMLLLSAFSATGIVLAVVGIAGTVAYSLSMRIREIGIRIAMGAGPGSVIALVSRQGLAPAFVGLILGLPLAVILTRYLRQMLFGISADDPAVFTISVAALALISILAAGAAAYRACRVDASTLLR